MFHCLAVLCGISTGSWLATLIELTLADTSPAAVLTTSEKSPCGDRDPGAVARADADGPGAVLGLAGGPSLRSVPVHAAAERAAAQTSTHEREPTNACHGGKTGQR